MILEILNDEQKKAVTGKGNILLTACPGSGKTRVVVHKVAYELNRLTSSKKYVIAVTFTNRAADEIVRRIDKLGINTDQLWTGTIHAFCLEWVLKPYSMYSENLKNGFSIADEVANEKLLIELQKKYFPKRYVNLNLRINKDGSYNFKNANEQKLIHEYYHVLEQKKQIDFNQLLFYSYQILSSNKLISESLANVFSFICVDEYQDTQDLQYAIIAEIIKKGNGKANVFFTGDVGQAVYGSLGGVAKSHDDIEEMIGCSLKQLSLSGNYRSSQRIIDFYRQFQIHSIEISALGENKENKGLITLNTNITKDDVVEEIIRLIQYHIDSGVPENEICVLVPQWWLITSITKQLKSKLPDINFDASGLAPMSKHRENIWHKISRMFLTEPSPKLYSARRRWADEILSELEILLGYSLLDEEGKIKQFLRIINSINSSESEGIKYIEDCFKQLIKLLKINIPKDSVLDEKWQLFFENINRWINDPDYAVPSDTESFKSYYREINGVVINTCVGVKGEEFKTVIAYGILHGYIPHWNDIYNQRDKGVTASKKLLYVICSRAKDNLHLIAEKGRQTKKKKALEINKELNSVQFEFDTI
ncbi:MAG: ATP-dependent helicase [Planctomycetes bacterium]|nr:ATP-dependent helicase [Planctomycetota bacterium]